MPSPKEKLEEFKKIAESPDPSYDPQSCAKAMDSKENSAYDELVKGYEHRLKQPLPSPLMKPYIGADEESRRLYRKIAELTHSLNFAAGQLSGMAHNADSHPESVFQELIAYGKKAHKEIYDA